MNSGTSEKLKMIRADLEAALKAVGQKHNILFKTGAMSYNELYFTMSMKGSFLNAIGSTEDADREEFELYCGRFGLTKEMFGKIFTLVGKDYKIVGIRPKARKYQVSATNCGKIFIFEASAVLRAMGLNGSIVVKRIA